MRKYCLKRWMRPWKNKEKVLLLQNEDLEFGIKAMEGVVEMGEKILEEGTAAEIFKSKEQLLARMETLMKMEFSEVPLESERIEFERGPSFQEMDGIKEIQERLKGLGLGKWWWMDEASAEHSKFLCWWKEEMFGGLWRRM